MKYLYQAAVILLFTFLGEALAALIPLGIPAAIWGLILLFAALCFKIVKPEQIKEASGWMIAILPVLFVAPTVNLLDQAGTLAASLPAFIVIIAVSTFVTFAAAGLITQLLSGSKEDKND